jgi:hypothetical protein
MDYNSYDFYNNYDYEKFWKWSDLNTDNDEFVSVAEIGLYVQTLQDNGELDNAQATFINELATSHAGDDLK